LLEEIHARGYIEIEDSYHYTHETDRMTGETKDEETVHAIYVGKRRAMTMTKHHETIRRWRKEGKP
jgi:hypothetical protein